MRDCDIMPADPAQNLPPAMLAAHPLLLLNGRYIVGGACCDLLFHVQNLAWRYCLGAGR